MPGQLELSGGRSIRRTAAGVDFGEYGNKAGCEAGMICSGSVASIGAVCCCPCCCWDGLLKCCVKASDLKSGWSKLDSSRSCKILSQPVLST